MKFRNIYVTATAMLLALAASSAQAQVSVSPNSALTESTSTSTVNNVLALTGPGIKDGFSFGGTGGSTSPMTGSFLSSISANGYYYADYLVTVGAGDVESVATTLTNSTGVTNLSERIYSYTGSFLGDASAGTGAEQVWSTNIPLPGASVSLVPATTLGAGQYVVEIRGTTSGIFAGTMSFTTALVPEAESLALLCAGLAALLVAVGYRRKGQRA